METIWKHKTEGTFPESQDESNQRFGSGHVTKSPPNGKGLKGDISKALNSLAGGKGVEPLFTESESVVLPLNDPPTNPLTHNTKPKWESIRNYGNSFSPFP